MNVSTRFAFIGALGLALSGCGGAETDEVGNVALAVVASAPRTLTFVPKGQAATRVIAAPAAAPLAASATTSLPIPARLFYPVAGQASDGLCWQGLVLDPAANLYPIAGGNYSKLTSDQHLVNGANDSNFFVTGGQSFWGALDDSRALFSAAPTVLRSAPFVAGSTFSDLVPGLTNGQAVTLGRAALAGNMFVTDGAGITRIAQGASVGTRFASGPQFRQPEAITSAPDGSLYVVDSGFNPPQLLKIAPSGATGTFAVAADGTARRAVAVDARGIVFWSAPAGFQRFTSTGIPLPGLPGPSDHPLFGNPMGSAFTRNGTFYTVDNFDCKHIYAYDVAHLPVYDDHLDFGANNFLLTGDGEQEFATANFNDSDAFAGSSAIRVRVSRDSGRGTHWKLMLFAHGNAAAFSGIHLAGYDKLVFFAKASRSVRLQAAFGSSDDSASRGFPVLDVGTSYRRFELDLNGLDLSRINSLFWVYLHKSVNPFDFSGVSVLIDQVQLVNTVN